MTDPGQIYASYEQVAVSMSVLDVDDLTVPAVATHAELQADTNAIRYTMDGTDPTTSSGMLLHSLDEPKTFLIGDIRNMKFIRDGGTNANLNVHYFDGNISLVS